jgi:DNA-directed RNA polymerase subunit omega
MLEQLKREEVVNQAGGRFKLTVLLQRRWNELLQGGRPLVDRRGRSDLEVAMQEIAEGKIAIDWEASELTPPDDVETK